MTTRGKLVLAIFFVLTASWAGGADVRPALAQTPPPPATPGQIVVKELAVQGYEGGPYIQRTLETVHDRTYPLFNQQFFFLNHAPGKPVDPMVDEFLHFILSQEGQDCVQREGRYLPLTAEVVQAQLTKLE